MKRAPLYLLVACICAPARAAPPAHPPLPPPRPNFEAPAPPTQQAPVGECAALQSGRAIGVNLPAIAGEGGCGIAAPVRINGVRLRSGAVLKLTPDAILNCDMAMELANFLDAEAARIEAAGAGKLAEVQHAGAYECRGTNRVVGAKLSEHASGNAIDLRAFKFTDGRSIVIGADRTPTWTGVKGAACARFNTVLGPGSNADHKDHLHLDLRKRKSTVICQWVLE